MGTSSDTWRQVQRLRPRGNHEIVWTRKPSPLRQCRRIPNLISPQQSGLCAQHDLTLHAAAARLKQNHPALSQRPLDIPLCMTARKLKLVAADSLHVPRVLGAVARVLAIRRGPSSVYVPDLPYRSSSPASDCQEDKQGATLRLAPPPSPCLLL